MPYVTSIERMAEAEGQAKGLVEGQAKGLAEGRAKGLAEGRVDIILRSLRRRWQGLTPELEAAIRDLPSERIERLADQWLDFSSPRELEEWLSLR